MLCALWESIWMKEAFNTFWKATDFIFTVNINVVLPILKCLNYSYKLWQANSCHKPAANVLCFYTPFWLSCRLPFLQVQKIVTKTKPIQPRTTHLTHTFQCIKKDESWHTQNTVAKRFPNASLCHITQAHLDKVGHSLNCLQNLLKSPEKKLLRK